MAEDTIKHLLIGCMLFALFGWALLTAVTQLGSTYGKDMSSFGNFNFSGFNDTANTFAGNAQNKSTIFGSSSIFNPIAGVVSTSIFTIVNDLANVVTAPFRLLGSIAINVLHIPVIFIIVIDAIIIIVFMLGVWSLVKIGN